MNVYFSDHVCSYGSFRCQNHRCVDINLRCDGYDQCADGSDEKNCSGKDDFHLFHLLQSLS